MYPGAIGGGVATGGGALAVTGFNTVGFIIAGVTIVLAGLAAFRLAPKSRRKFVA